MDALIKCTFNAECCWASHSVTWRPKWENTQIFLHITPVVAQPHRMLDHHHPPPWLAFIPGAGPLPANRASQSCHILEILCARVTGTVGGLLKVVGPLIWWLQICNRDFPSTGFLNRTSQFHSFFLRKRGPLLPGKEHLRGTTSMLNHHEEKIDFEHLLFPLPVQCNTTFTSNHYAMQ